MVLERKVPPPPPSGKKSTKVSNTFLDFKTQRFLTFFCHIFTFTKTTQQPLPGTPTISLRPLGLVCVSRVKRLVKKKKKKKKEKETDLRERRETTTTRKKRRGEERLRRLGF